MINTPPQLLIIHRGPPEERGFLHQKISPTKNKWAYYSGVSINLQTACQHQGGAQSLGLEKPSEGAKHPTHPRGLHWPLLKAQPASRQGGISTSCWPLVNSIFIVLSNRKKCFQPRHFASHPLDCDDINCLEGMRRPKTAA